MPRGSAVVAQEGQGAVDRGQLVPRRTGGRGVRGAPTDSAHEARHAVSSNPPIRCNTVAACRTPPADAEPTTVSSPVSTACNGIIRSGSYRTRARRELLIKDRSQDD